MPRKKPKIPTIAIAGGTASGKSTVARRIVEAFDPHRVVLLEQDAYYKNLSHLPLRDRRRVNFDHPDAFDDALLLRHLTALKAGRAIDAPVYSFTRYTREPFTHHIAPGDAIVVEGILLLASPELRDAFDIKIYVDAEDDIRLIRRIVRDVKERGRSLESVIDQYQSTVRPMHLTFIYPQRRVADIIIPSAGRNDIAIDWVIGAVRERLGKR
jgi:uridine kinase